MKKRTIALAALAVLLLGACGGETVAAGSPGDEPTQPRRTIDTGRTDPTTRPTTAPTTEPTPVPTTPTTEPTTEPPPVPTTRPTPTTRPVPGPTAPTTPTTVPMPTSPPVGGGTAAQLVGVWRGDARDILGNPATVETVLQPGGRFSQTFSGTGDPIFITGTYDVLDEGVIRFHIEEHTDRWCGPLGCTTIRLPTDETTYYQFLDRDTLVTWGDQDPARVRHTRVA